jgi:hypothetical protein
MEDNLMQLAHRLQYQYRTSYETTNSVLVKMHIIEVFYNNTLIQFSNDDSTALEETVSEWIHAMCMIHCRNQLTLRKLEEFQDWLNSLEMEL